MAKGPNWYDVWFPNLAPGIETMKLGQEPATPAQWTAFTRKYRAEISTPDNSHALELLAALSHQANFSVGCYCEDEAHCHRSGLRALLVEKGAVVNARVSASAHNGHTDSSVRDTAVYHRKE